MLVVTEVMQMIAQRSPRKRVFSLTFTMLAMLAMLSVGACGSTPPVVQSSQPANAGDRAAAIALNQVGVPYRYGGNSPRGFDCSGLVQYSYRNAGVNIPRTTGQLWNAAQTVNRSDLRAGDLLFFSVDGKMSHVGMYLGDGDFVHAPKSGRTVSVTSLDSPFYKAALVRAGRVY